MVIAGIRSARPSHRPRDTTRCTRHGARSDSLSALFLAATGIEPLVLQPPRYARTAVRQLRDDLEYVRNAWPLPRVRAPMAVDDLPAVRHRVAAPGLVRGDSGSRLHLTDEEKRRPSGRAERIVLTL